MSYTGKFKSDDKIVLSSITGPRQFSRASGQPKAVGRAMMNKWRILAIDDDPLTLKLVEETLNDAYEVLTLANPQDAERLIELFQPDLVILDIVMPSLDGFQLLNHLKSNQATEQMPVIFLSAKDSHEIIKKAYSEGAQLYLTKPFQPDRLRRNINLTFKQAPPATRKKKYSPSEVRARLDFFSASDLSGARQKNRVVGTDDQR